MPALNLTSPQAVKEAMAEFDRLGREAFLANYGYRRAREYFLLMDGKRYDSKAIAGVAHGYEHPESGPLPPSAFSGGEQTVRRVLQTLGFTVVKGTSAPGAPDALVLVQNEVTVGGQYDFWADDTGTRYQFPNQYRNRVLVGLPFVYYRGVRRVGGRRGVPEYFGAGVIGDIWPDPVQSTDTPAKNLRWYCAIENYEPFLEPVSAKRGNRAYENIKTSMGWRTGVREISAEVFDDILSDALGKRQATRTKEPSVVSARVLQSDPSELLIARPASKIGGVARASRYSSRRTKEIGDWAEELVYRWLCDTLTPSERDTIDWVAQRGETPGWDISYTSDASAHISVEVKATMSARFSVVEITANEWHAAELQGDDFVLALVSRALSQQPHIALLWNPLKHVRDGSLTVEPTSFRLTSRLGASG